MSTQINNNNHWSFKILLNLGTKSSKSKLKLRKGNPPKPPSLTCKNTEVQTQQLQMTALQTKSQATKNLESKQVFRQCKLFINNKIYIFQSCYLWQIDLAIKKITNSLSCLRANQTVFNICYNEIESFIRCKLLYLLWVVKLFKYKFQYL